MTILLAPASVLDSSRLPALSAGFSPSSWIISPLRSNKCTFLSNAVYPVGNPLLSCQDLFLVDPPAGVQAGRCCIWVQVSLGPAPDTLPRCSLFQPFKQQSQTDGEEINGTYLCSRSRRHFQRLSSPLCCIDVYLFFLYIPAAFPVRVRWREEEEEGGGC